MLRGILYEIVQADDLGATVRLLPESAVYAGHFPGYPITPGVCLVQIALELIAEMAGQAGHDEKEMPAMTLCPTPIGHLSSDKFPQQ